MSLKPFKQNSYNIISTFCSNMSNHLLNTPERTIEHLLDAIKQPNLELVKEIYPKIASGLWYRENKRIVYAVVKCARLDMLEWAYTIAPETMWDIRILNHIKEYGNDECYNFIANKIDTDIVKLDIYNCIIAVTNTSDKKSNTPMRVFRSILSDSYKPQRDRILMMIIGADHILLFKWMLERYSTYIQNGIHVNSGSTPIIPVMAMSHANHPERISILKYLCDNTRINNPNQMMEYAVKADNMNALEYISSLERFRPAYGNALTKAIERRNVKMCTYILNTFELDIDTKRRKVADALRLGFIDIADLFISNTNSQLIKPENVWHIVSGLNITAIKCIRRVITCPWTSTNLINPIKFEMLVMHNIKCSDSTFTTILKLLINYGTPVTFDTINNATYKRNYQSYECTYDQYILLYNAYANKKSNNNELSEKLPTLMDTAVYHNKIEIVKFLIKNGIGMSTKWFLNALQLEHYDMLDTLIDACGRRRTNNSIEDILIVIQENPGDYTSLLRIAVKNNKVKYVAIFIACGGEADAEMKAIAKASGNQKMIDALNVSR